MSDDLTNHPLYRGGDATRYWAHETKLKNQQSMDALMLVPKKDFVEVRIATDYAALQQQLANRTIEIEDNGFTFGGPSFRTVKVDDYIRELKHRAEHAEARVRELEQQIKGDCHATR